MSSKLKLFLVFKIIFVIIIKYIVNDILNYLCVMNYGYITIKSTYILKLLIAIILLTINFLDSK